VRKALLALAFFAGTAAGQPAQDARWSSYRDFWFDYDSSSLHRVDLDNVADVANYLRQHPAYRLAIDNAEADALRRQRVATVRAALISAGVPGYKIQVGVFGDERFKRERRVEVLVDTRE
jgi:outer membrane protein OmpA-like peptidoglycan-associated protein